MASHPCGWDSTEVSPLNMEKEELTRPTRKYLNFEMLRNKGETQKEGYLDMGYNKDIRPKAKGKWNKLAREKGLVGDAIMTGQEGGIGFKRVGELENLEAEEDRKTKRKYGRSSKETMMAIEQHCREL